MTSQYKGVSWSKHNKRWKVQTRHQNKVHHICYSDDETEAYKRYLEKRKQLTKKELK